VLLLDHLQPFGLLILQEFVGTAFDIDIYGRRAACLGQNHFPTSKIQRKVGSTLLDHNLPNGQPSIYKDIAVSFQTGLVGIDLHGDFVATLAEVNPRLRGRSHPFFAVGAHRQDLLTDFADGDIIVTEATNDLMNAFIEKASAIILKLLNSAIANAENNEGADIDVLRVAEIQVGEGMTMKRFAARAKGRGNRILKRTSNIFIRVQEV